MRPEAKLRREFETARGISAKHERDDTLGKLTWRSTKWGDIEIMLMQNQSSIGEEIDTDVECEPVGVIPEEQSGLISQKTLKDVDQTTKEPPSKPFLRRDVLMEVIKRRHEIVRGKGREAFRSGGFQVGLSVR